MRGVYLVLANFANFLHCIFPFLEKIPRKFLPMPIENVVTFVARTGRDLQRYHKGYRQVVGCIPYRYRKTSQSSSIDGTLVEELEVLLISSQKSQAMLFPKGGWDNDETIGEAALRETREEAGVTGNVDVKHRLGKWKYQSKRCGKIYEGYMFSLLVKKEYEDWPEKNLRTRRWVTVTEAREVCKNWWMREALDELVRRQRHLQLKKEENETHK